MQIITLTQNNEKEVLKKALQILKNGGTIVYPTDTSYGLGCDALNLNAIKKIYRIKERAPKRPMHVVIPSLSWAKKTVHWNNSAEVLTKKYWPGPLSIALPLKSKEKGLKAISSTNFLGLRSPNNSFAINLVKGLKRPITATSANPSAIISKGFDSYTVKDVVTQFNKQKYKPDLIIDAGRLKKVKPSTFVLINNEKVEIIRHGPISEKDILQTLK